MDDPLEDDAVLLVDTVDRLRLLELKLDSVLALEYDDDVERVDELKVLDVLSDEVDWLDAVLLLRLDLLLTLLYVELTLDVLVLVVTVCEDDELSVDAEEIVEEEDELPVLGVRLDELDNVLALLGVPLL